VKKGQVYRGTLARASERAGLGVIVAIVRRLGCARLYCYIGLCVGESSSFLLYQKGAKALAFAFYPNPCSLAWR
jgi:hypothetical protein